MASAHALLCAAAALALGGCIDVEDLTFVSGGGGGGGAGGGAGGQSDGGAGGTAADGGGGAAAAYDYVAMVLEAGPEAYYRLNEATGSIDVLDSSGNEHHAVVGAGVEDQVVREFPGALTDGDTATTLSNSAYLILSPNDLGIAVDQPYSIEAWVQVHYDDSISNLFPTATGLADFNTFIGTNGVSHKRHYDETSYQEIAGPRSYLRDSLHHVVVTFDGESAQIYVDKVRGFDVPTAVPLDLPALLEPVRVAEVGAVDSITFDEIAFYKSALPDHVVFAHYDCGHDGVCEPPVEP